MMTILFVAAMLAGPAGAATPATIAQANGPAIVSPFGPAWHVLLGKWEGVGDGSPGGGGGTASFEFDLDNHVIVRRSTSDYPAAGGRPAVHHEDLMVIYPASSGTGESAVYFDNEGHAIEYAASWTPGDDTLVFVTPAGVQGPRFRLTYVVVDTDTMNVSFDMAAPGSDAFKPYVAGVMKRVSSR